MGGVNCPPPRREVSEEMKEQYVNKLASYCGEVFTGTSLFFAGNAEIEAAVLTSNGLDVAIEKFEKSQRTFGSAKLMLGSVASLWDQVSAGESVDFVSQLDQLERCAELVGIVCMELDTLDDTSSLQEALWAQPELTANIVAAMDAIHVATGWQAEFAQNAVHAIA